MDHPQRVLSLVILNSPHERSPEAQALVEKRAADTEGGAGATIDETLARWFTPSFLTERPDVVAVIRDWVLANDPQSYAACRAVLAHGVRELIRPEPAITHPALVVTCENDSGSTPAMSHAIASEINGAQVEIIPRLQHLGLVENLTCSQHQFCGLLRDYPTANPTIPRPISLRKNLMGKTVNNMISGGQAAVTALQVEKTDHVFGLIGSATMEMFDALYDADDINFIGIHDERTGTHMADGYARASGVQALFLLARMVLERPILSPVLPRRKRPSRQWCRLLVRCRASINIAYAFQEVDQQALFTPVTKKTWTAPSAERVPELFREAFRLALTPRMGPVQRICHATCWRRRLTLQTFRNRTIQDNITACRRHPEIAAAAALLGGARGR